MSFDPGTGLATVLPTMKFKKPDGTTVDFPQVTGVPVVFPQSMGQQATIAYPVKAGDGCLIIVAEQSIDYWLYGQETDTDLDFDLTNSICIPGLFAKANPVMAEACNGNGRGGRCEGHEGHCQGRLRPSRRWNDNAQRQCNREWELHHAGRRGQSELMGGRKYGPGGKAWRRRNRHNGWTSTPAMSRRTPRRPFPGKSAVGAPAMYS